MTVRFVKSKYLKTKGFSRWELRNSFYFNQITSFILALSWTQTWGTCYVNEPLSPIFLIGNLTEGVNAPKIQWQSNEKLIIGRMLLNCVIKNAPSLITTRTYYLFDFLIIFWMLIREHLRLLNMVIDKSVMIIQLKTNHNEDSIHFTWAKWKYSQKTGQGENDYYSDSR